MLFIFCGLLSGGKSDVALTLSERINAVYVRVGTVNPESEHCRMLDKECYSKFYTLVHDNLKLGFNVVTDLVNDTHLLHHAFRNIALSLSVPCQNVEVIYSFKSQHKHRVENRVSGLSGVTGLDCEQLQPSYFEPLNKQRLQLDTAILSVAECVEEIMLLTACEKARR